MIESAIRENIISYHSIDYIFQSWYCFLPGCKYCISSTRLYLIGCNLSGPEAFPKYFGKLVSLRYLDLSKNPLFVLPRGNNGLSKITSLRLEHCKSLRCLEVELIPSSLEVVNINYCTEGT